MLSRSSTIRGLALVSSKSIPRVAALASTSASLARKDVSSLVSTYRLPLALQLRASLHTKSGSSSTSSNSSQRRQSSEKDSHKKEDPRNRRLEGSATVMLGIFITGSLLSYAAQFRNSHRDPAQSLPLPAVAEAAEKSNKSDEEGKAAAADEEEGESEVEDEEDLDNFDDIVLGQFGEQALPADVLGPLKVVRASTLESLVLDPEVDVLLEILAPGCMTCGRVKYVFQALAEAFKDTPSVRVCKMDGRNNYVPGFLPEEEENATPQFKAYPAGMLKKEQMIRSAAQMKELADYYTQKRRAKKAKKPLPVQLITRKEIAGVGDTWNRTHFPPSLGEDLIQWFHERATVKFDKEEIIRRYRAAAPAAAAAFAEDRRKNPSTEAQVVALSPCGAEMNAFVTQSDLNLVGLASHESVLEKQVVLRECMLKKQDACHNYWSMVSDLSKTLDPGPKEPSPSKKASSSTATDKNGRS